jgi:hypothetical protein
MSAGRSLAFARTNTHASRYPHRRYRRLIAWTASLSFVRGTTVPSLHLGQERWVLGHIPIMKGGAQMPAPPGVCES